MQNYIHLMCDSAMAYHLENFQCWQLIIENLGELTKFYVSLKNKINFLAQERIKMDSNHSKLPHYHLKVPFE